MEEPSGWAAMFDAYSLFDKSRHESLCCRHISCRRTELVGRKSEGVTAQRPTGRGASPAPTSTEGRSEHAAEAANWRVLHCPARPRGAGGLSVVGLGSSRGSYWLYKESRGAH